jgi:hypothetical protein
VTPARLATCSALITAATIGGGCGLPRGEALLRPSDVSAAVERFVPVRLARLPALKFSSAFPDVQARYAGGSTRERVLILVFRSTEATVQVLGKRPPEIPGVVALPYRNVVVLYQHAPGAPSRTVQLRAVLHGIALRG